MTKKRAFKLMAKFKGGVTSPRDFRVSSLHCGIKRMRRDLVLLVSNLPAVSCGVFTQNRVKAAPVIVCKEHLNKMTAQALIINSGNANCCTGKAGLKNAYLMTELVARELGLYKEDVLVASTGVIGKQLPMEKIKRAIPPLVRELGVTGGRGAAEGIMTTDSFPKEAACRIKIKGKTVTIGAMAKGAGMVHPNMATMLCFITTDVYITRRALKLALSGAVERSFNSISIDGETSTNDTVLAMANGSAGNGLLDRNDKDFMKFCGALNGVTEELAKSMVRDGEGATKFIQINVKGARTDANARRIAKKLATSPLFKTAAFGGDPNWGRIAASVGSSGVLFDPDKLDIYLGRTRVVRNGAGAAADKGALRKIFNEKELNVTVDIQSGGKDYTVWTCDLTPDYVKLNAHYTT